MKKKHDVAVRLQVRLPQSLHEQIRLCAGADGRSLNGQIVFALKTWSDAQQKDAAFEGVETASHA